MCAGAIGWAQVPRIVVGAPDERGIFYVGGPEAVSSACYCDRGVLAGECMALMQEFFRSRR